MAQQRPAPVFEDEEVPMLPTGLGPVEARKVVIASVHFQDLRNRFMHSGRKEFVLPAPKKGLVSYVNIYDSVQVVSDHSDQDTPGELTPKHVLVETIVSDLIRTWGNLHTSMMGVKKVGVMAIKGELATPAELRELNSVEETLCRSLVEEADMIEKGAVKGGVITEVHRKALEWLDSENRGWYRSIEKGHTKRSVISGNRIPLAAIVDDGADLIEYYVKYGLNPLDYEDTHIDAMLKANPKIRQLTEERLGIGSKVA
jgi:hypothetical protein